MNEKKILQFSNLRLSNSSTWCLECDAVLERYRSFDAVASADRTMVATFTKANMNKMKDENHPLYVIVQNLLLRASLMDLANCTCHN